MGRAYELVLQTCQKGKNTVVSLMGPYNNLFTVTRLGNLSGNKLLESKKYNEVNALNTRSHEIETTSHHRNRNILDEFTSTVNHSPRSIERDAKNYNQIIQYWRHGGLDNYYNLIHFLMKEYGGGYNLPNPDPPFEYPEYGIYHPEYGYFQSLSEYYTAAKYHKGQQAIGIMFHSGMHLEQNIPTITCLLEALPEFAIIPTHSTPETNLACIDNFFLQNGKPIVDALINLKYFRLNGGPLGGDPALTTELLKKLNVPVFAPLSMFSQDIEEWDDNIAGINPILTIMAVVWPELDGCIEPIPCCGLQTIQNENTEVKEIRAISERVGKISRRIRNWIRLKNIPNAEKKIAIIIYNYPPGEASLAGASYLDVFVSVKRLLKTLASDGYSVEIPDEPLHSLFEERKLYNTARWSNLKDTANYSERYSLDKYLNFFSFLPTRVQFDLTEHWGSPPGNIMVYGDNFIIPGIKCGNVFVGIQPARPPLTEEDVASAAHDKTKPPHHQYVAFYRWLSEEFKADLIFHVGTHGLAEFTKGKEIGMSESCFPDLLIGDIPHLYLYSVTNTSEATIAKRRLYGTLLSYNSPPFSTSDLYEQYLDLEHLIEEREEAIKQGQDLRKERLEKKIITLATDLHIESDSIPEIHEILYDMKRSIIPKGLHILGEKYEAQDIKGYIECILRYDRDETSSLNRILAESLGIPYDEALRNRQSYTHQLDAIDIWSRKIISNLIDFGIEKAIAESGVAENKYEKLRETLEQGLLLSQDYADNSHELKNCVRGLHAEFIRPALGGDVIRRPDVLPTGFNINQFDPTKIPTGTAVERGAEIAENTIRTYLSQEGNFPESVGMVL
ncbi:MAG: cobaltochelatase subunit CobN, partial [Methanospirillum sp.]|uniref:cobaltochelatase subunit CobN n=1 Tax=Methanospirillum sp. TaxID=45200 RepID=UPI0023707303